MRYRKNINSNWKQVVGKCFASLIARIFVVSVEIVTTEKCCHTSQDVKRIDACETELTTCLI